MRRVRRCVEGAMLPVYERIIELYAPYVLVRCAQYTNGRRQAQQYDSPAFLDQWIR